MRANILKGGPRTGRSIQTQHERTSNSYAFGWNCILIHLSYFNQILRFPDGKNWERGLYWGSKRKWVLSKRKEADEICYCEEFVEQTNM